MQCSYFHRNFVDKMWYFEIGDDAKNCPDRFIPLYKTDGLEERTLQHLYRPIIAAVAEVEWRRIYEDYDLAYAKIFHNYMEDVGLTDDERMQMNESYEKRNEAHTIAIQWRAWGEQE